MGIQISFDRISASDIKFIQEKFINDYLIVTTIKDTNNTPLIKGTLQPEKEEYFINKIIQNKNNNIKGIIIYGMNNQDISVIDKYKQLLKFNVTNIFIYIGGLFEWLLLNKQHPNVFELDNHIDNFDYFRLLSKPNEKILSNNL
jgi:hypothetical protein